MERLRRILLISATMTGFIGIAVAIARIAPSTAGWLLVSSILTLILYAWTWEYMLRGVDVRQGAKPRK